MARRWRILDIKAELADQGGGGDQRGGRPRIGLRRRRVDARELHRHDRRARAAIRPLRRAGEQRDLGALRRDREHHARDADAHGGHGLQFGRLGHPGGGAGDGAQRRRLDRQHRLGRRPSWACPTR